MSRSLSLSLSLFDPDQISNYNRLDRSSRFVIVESIVISRAANKFGRSFDRGRRSRERKKREGEGILSISRIDSRRDRGRDFQSSRLEAELIPGEIQKFGKREPPPRADEDRGSCRKLLGRPRGSSYLISRGPVRNRGSRGSIAAELLNKIYGRVRYNEITFDIEVALSPLFSPSRMHSSPFAPLDNLRSENPTDLSLSLSRCNETAGLN